ncbi:hypothetical protein PR048_025460 [Dryococelus australis]|uniref:Uncharacterized protein n=1 Tax=Dryococelus australis TaxID=614101 RepID=A0ABQ9GRC9_9NEOP|nr:hypothetical protein PR048_025460 [Dryococelus australis]
MLVETIECERRRDVRKKSTAIDDNRRRGKISAQKSLEPRGTDYPSKHERSFMLQEREVNMVKRRNARAREMGDPRENPLTSGSVRHDFHMRKSGSDLAGNRALIPVENGMCLTLLRCTYTNTCLYRFTGRQTKENIRDPSVQSEPLLCDSRRRHIQCSDLLWSLVRGGAPPDPDSAVALFPGKLTGRLPRSVEGVCATRVNQFPTRVHFAGRLGVKRARNTRFIVSDYIIRVVEAHVEGIMQQSDPTHLVFKIKPTWRKREGNT